MGYLLPSAGHTGFLEIRRRGLSCACWKMGSDSLPRDISNRNWAGCAEAKGENRKRWACDRNSRHFSLPGTYSPWFPRTISAKTLDPHGLGIEKENRGFGYDAVRPKVCEVYAEAHRREGCAPRCSGILSSRQTHP